MDKPTDTWLITDGEGNEITLLFQCKTIEDVRDDMARDLEMTGGYFARRLTRSELAERVRPVDRVTTPELYY